MKKIRLGESANDNAITQEAIRFIQRIYDALKHTQSYTLNAVNGKNKTIRDNNAMMSLHAVSKTIEQLEPWNDIIEAKQNGEYIHEGKLKSHKLDIVSGPEYNFGQSLVNSEVDEDA